MEQNNQDNNGNSSSISSHPPPAACYTVSVSQHTMLEMLIQGCKNTNKPILCLTGVEHVKVWLVFLPSRLGLVLACLECLLKRWLFSQWPGCLSTQEKFTPPPGCQNRKQTWFMTSQCLEEQWVGTEHSTARGLISILRSVEWSGFGSLGKHRCFKCNMDGYKHSSGVMLENIRTLKQSSVEWRLARITL